MDKQNSEIVNSRDVALIMSLQGFGPKKAERIREDLALAQAAGKRRPLGAVLSLARSLLEAIRALPGVARGGEDHAGGQIGRAHV